MRQLVRVAAATSVLALLCAALPLPVGLTASAGIRGRVIDEAGKPVPGVRLDMEFKGESRTKVTRTQETDKNGGFVRMGIPDGKWQITFTKAGYKTYIMEIFLSLGGFSEAGDVVLKAAPAAAATPAGLEGLAGAAAQTAEADTSVAAYAAAVEAAKAGRYDERRPRSRTCSPSTRTRRASTTTSATCTG